MPNFGRSGDLVDSVVCSQYFMIMAIFILEMEKFVRQNSSDLARTAIAKYLIEQFNQ